MLKVKSKRQYAHIHGVYTHMIAGRYEDIGTQVPHVNQSYARKLTMHVIKPKSTSFQKASLCLNNYFSVGKGSWRLKRYK